MLIYQKYFREHAYGLATQTFGPWFSELLIMLFVSGIAFVILLITLYAVFRRAPHTWWLWGTLIVSSSYSRNLDRTDLHRAALQ